jgi:hypothetical protein
MHFGHRLSRGASRIFARKFRCRNGGDLAKVAVYLGVTSVLVFSALLFSQSKPSSPSAHSSKTPHSTPSTTLLTDAQMSRMSSDQLAKWVFAHHGCYSCHTLGSDGKFGLTERGKQVGKGFEGCIPLLTSMIGIAQLSPLDRTPEERHKVARFREFGCTTCHMLTPGRIGLTTYGSKLKSLHITCPDVERLLTQRR